MLDTIRTLDRYIRAMQQIQRIVEEVDRDCDESHHTMAMALDDIAEVIKRLNEE